MMLNNGLCIVLNDWGDLTAAWVVFYGREYVCLSLDRIIIDCGANIGAFSLGSCCVTGT